MNKRRNYESEAMVAALRDDDPSNDLLESVAIAFALGLGFLRVGAGLTEVLFPRLFLRVLGRAGAATDGAALGFRMKGGRDLGLGLATLAAATNGDRKAVADMTATGLIIDTIDGIAVHRDGGLSLRAPVYPFGGPLGVIVGIASAFAAAMLRRPTKG